tara:strand:+ start:99 stop:665 length:567 start_codon:yes stop_codon:yes gene_type:complete
LQSDEWQLESTRYVEKMISDLIKHDTSDNYDESWGEFLDKLESWDIPIDIHMYIADLLNKQRLSMLFVYQKIVGKLVLIPNFVNPFTKTNGEHKGGHLISKLISGKSTPLLNRKISFKEIKSSDGIHKAMTKLLELDSLYMFRLNPKLRQKIKVILDWWIPEYCPNYILTGGADQILWATKTEEKFGI